MSTIPPIRRELLVDADPEAAFEVFTAGVGRSLATEDDRSVADGFLAVAVRPWQVMVHAPNPASWSSR